MWHRIVESKTKSLLGNAIYMMYTYTSIHTCSKKPAKPHSKKVGDTELMPFDESPVFGITPADDQYVYEQQNWSNRGISFDNNNYDEHVFDEHSFDENMFDETPTTHN